MKISKLTSAYLAGLVDGEGYIGILRTKKGNKSHWFSNREFIFTPVIKVTMTDKDTIKWLYDSFGGTFETRKAHGNARESYGWMAKNAKPVEFLKFIYPHLRIKRRQAETLFRFPYGKAGYQIPDEMYESRIKLYDQIRSLNSRGAA